MSNEPLLVIISSPSGAGKTTLTNRLRDKIGELAFSVSHTTRQPRDNEQNGREYHFVDRADFEERIARDEFLEWAFVHGNFYGTSKTEIQRARGSRGLIFDIDHQGARQIRATHPEAVAIFILPPSLKVLEARLRGRASEDEDTVLRRFAAARHEISHYAEFDYLLLNKDLDEATDRLVGIFLAEESRRQRAAPHAEALLTNNAIR